MSKCILVMDMPRNCYGCPCRNVLYNFCTVTNESTDTDINRPSHCPLKPLPQKKEVRDSYESLYYTMGYNECLDEILGDVSDDI